MSRVWRRANWTWTFILVLVTERSPAAVFLRAHCLCLTKETMGNAESVASSGGDRPGPLIEEGRRLVGMGFHEGAIAKFRRAYELHKEGGSTCAAAAALRQAAEAGLMGAAPDYELAATGFEEAGRLMVANDITTFVAPTCFANSIFCLLAAGRGKTAMSKLENFEQLDISFVTCLEGTAARKIATCFTGGGKAETRECVEGFKYADSAMPVWRIGLLDKIVDRL